MSIHRPFEGAASSREALTAANRRARVVLGRHPLVRGTGFLLFLLVAIGGCNNDRPTPSKARPRDTLPPDVRKKKAPDLRLTPAERRRVFRRLVANVAKIGWDSKGGENDGELMTFTCSRSELPSRITGLAKTLEDEKGFFKHHRISVALAFAGRASKEVSDAALTLVKDVPFLSELDLSFSRRFTHEGLRELAGSGIKFLDLSQLNLTSAGGVDAALEGLADYSKLERLRLDSSNVGNQGIAHLKDLKSLRVLHLYDSRVTDRGLASLSDLSGLEELSLTHCTVRSEGLKHLARLTNLKKLDLSGTLVTHVKPLRALHVLSELDLGETSIDNDGIASLTGLTKLKSLSLYKTTLSERGFEQLGEMVDLERLNITGIKLNLACIQHLKPLADLELLEFDATEQVTPAAVASILGTKVALQTRGLR